MDIQNRNEEMPHYRAHRIFKSTEFSPITKSDLSVIGHIHHTNGHDINSQKK